MKSSWSEHISWVVRNILVLFAQAAGLFAMSFFTPGLHVTSLSWAIVAVFLIALFNLILWPFVTAYALPALVYTMGFGALLLNALVVWMVSIITRGMIVEGAALALVPVGLALVNIAASAVLRLDDDDTNARARYTDYFQHILDGGHKVDWESPPKKSVGTIFLEIDGLAHPVLEAAVKKGIMPTLAGWLESGSHKLVEWETDFSSQTGASQAGILHGNNSDIPGYRWYEKENEKMITSSNFTDAPVIEQRISNGNGLLAKNGASRSNLFSGDAENTLLTYSRIGKISRLYTKSWYYFYSNPYSFARTIVFSIWDMLLETWSRVRHRVQNVQPRMSRSFLYYGIRAVAVVLMRDVTTYTVIGDIVAGQADAVYASYCAYDEVAHHSGVEDKDVFIVLRQLDKSFARIEHASKRASRDYQFVLLSDHGQSNGATFEQRTGISLVKLVQRLLPQGTVIRSELESTASRPTEIVTHPIHELNAAGRVLRRSLSSLFMGHPAKRDMEDPSKTDVIILGSGNSGLIYFTKSKDRLTLQQINTTYPKLINGLLQNEWLAFAMVLSENGDVMVIGRDGTNNLTKQRVEGKDPLEEFGPNAAKHLLRESSFKYTPDILLNTRYDREKNEVASFEKLIGSHGGMGGYQSRPFLLYPAEWTLLNGGEKIVGAENVYRTLKHELERLETTPGAGPETSREGQSGSWEEPHSVRTGFTSQSNSTRASPASPRRRPGTTDLRLDQKSADRPSRQN